MIWIVGCADSSAGISSHIRRGGLEAIHQPQRRDDSNKGNVHPTLCAVINDDVLCGGICFGEEPVICGTSMYE